MVLSRKHFVAASGTTFAALAIPRYPANAAEFDWRLAMDAPADHHTTHRLIEAAAKIKQDTSGRLDIQVFPNNMLGDSTSQIVQVRQGAVQIVTSVDLVLSNVVPLAGITATPFVFANAKDGLATTSGPLGRLRRDAIAKIGVHAFSRSWNSGFRQTINGTRPITTPDDLKGLKIRIPVSPVMTALFKALGASPTPIGANEMYVALQTHLADGIELPMASIEAYKIYEIQKYVSYTNHIWTSYSLLANAEAFSRLPKNIQDITENAIDQAAALDSEDVAHLETRLESQLKTQGMSFNQADIPAFRNAVRRAGLYAQWRDTYGSEAWALLEKSVGKLT